MTDLHTLLASKKMLWAGWILSALLVVALVFSGVMKLIKPTAITDEFTRLGWPDVTVGLGIVEIACALVYAIPQTAVLGAILVTGYLGGAIATHVRIHDDFVPPLVMGVLAWLALYLRDARLRALLPLRT
jgi:hypothetical protein